MTEDFAPSSSPGDGVFVSPDDGLASLVRLHDLEERLRRFEKAFTTADGIAPKNPEWYWGRRIVKNDLNILAGEQGLGKSQFGTYLAGNVSREGNDAEPHNVLIMSAEDDAQTVIVPRLIAYDARLSNVALLNDDIGMALTPEHLPTLADAIETFGAELCVIDPVSAFIDKQTDTYKDAHVREMLRTLRAIAHGLGCTFLLVMHTKKGQERVAVNMVGGSIAWTAAPRSVLVMTRDEDADPTVDRVLYHPKCNVGPEQGPLACSIEAGIVYDNHGEPVATSTLQIAGEIDAPTLAEVYGLSSRTTKLEQAKTWLRDALADGDVPAQEIESRVEREPFGMRTVNTAKEALGVRSMQTADGWVWTLHSG